MAKYTGSEFALQKYVIELLRLQAKPGVLYYHCPNGEYRSPRTGARLKAMGVRRGVADICLVVKGRAYFLELKNGKGVWSEAQRAFATLVVNAGGYYSLASSPEQATEVLQLWDAIPAVDSARAAA